MDAIAHRGCAEQFPENTLLAIESVVDHVDRVELDVRQCGSGEIVLFHDATTAALTGEEHQVDSTDYETLRGLSVLDTDEHVPTLADALGTIPPDVDVQLDLKTNGIAADVKRVADQYDHDVYLCSTDTSALTEATALSWDAAAGYVSFAYFEDEDVDPSTVTESEQRDAVESAVALDCSFVEVPYSLAVESDVVDAAHDAELDVVAWPIPTRDQLDAIAARDVDGAMLDRVDIL